MSKFGTTVNKFDALAENPDMKPKEKEQIVNLPEEMKSTKVDTRYTNFATFQSKLLGMDLKGQFIDVFNVLMKNSRNIELPETLKGDDCFIYFLTSGHENKIFERKSVMQTDVGFPFVHLRKDLQAKLLEMTISQEELDDCLKASINALRKLFTNPNEQQKDFGACISYRISIQLISRKKPTALAKFLEAYIKDLDPDSAAHNPRYLNFVTWLFCQLDQTLASYENILKMMTSFYDRVLINQANKLKYNEHQAIHKLYNIDVAYDFYRSIKPNLKSEAQKGFQQVFVSQLLTLERLRPQIKVAELAKTMLAKVTGKINAVASESNKRELFKTIVISADEFQQQLTEPLINLLAGCEFKIAATDKKLIEILQKKQFEVLGYGAKAKQLDDKANKTKAVQQPRAQEVPKPVVKAETIAQVHNETSICRTIAIFTFLLTFTYLALITIIFSKDDHTVLGKVESAVSTAYELVSHIFKAVLRAERNNIAKIK